jgi:hypothetical protein
MKMSEEILNLEYLVFKMENEMDELERTKRIRIYFNSFRTKKKKYNRNI